MSRTAHNSCMATHTMEQVGDVEGLVHEKHSWWEFNGMWNSCFLFPFPQGVWAQFTKTTFCWKLYEITRNPQMSFTFHWIPIMNVFHEPAPQHPPLVPCGMALDHITKNECLMELHEIFSISPHHHKGWGLGSKAQNNVMSITKNVSKLSPTLPYLEVAKHELSVQI